MFNGDVSQRCFTSTLRTRGTGHGQVLVLSGGYNLWNEKFWVRKVLLPFTLP